MAHHKKYYTRKKLEKEKAQKNQSKYALEIMGRISKK